METSENKLMVCLLHQIKEVKYFNENVDKWQGKASSSRIWKTFQAHFSEADRVQRQRNKLQQKSAQDTGHHSAQAVEELKKRLEEKLALEISAMTLAANETI